MSDEYSSKYKYTISSEHFELIFQIKTELDDVNIAETVKDVKWAVDEYLKSSHAPMEAWHFLLGHLIRLGIKVLYMTHLPVKGPRQSYISEEYYPNSIARFPSIFETKPQKQQT